MTTVRAWLLPLLLIANGALSILIAERAAELRRSWQVWEVRSEAQAHLKDETNEEAHSTRSGRAEGAP